ncbi:MAG: hypothetical protein CMP67_07245, partial [Flavobacteriales bacterium]|nr:hypothetical protein [Flavobacteriales bacterium]
ITISGTPTSAGTFNYTITPDGCGSALATGTITVHARPTVTVNDATICEGDAAATFTATSTTATSWSWSENGSGTEQTTTGTAAGSYTVVVTDVNTCTSLPASGTLTVNARPTVTVNDATICEGDAATTFTATSATATAWAWSGNGSGTEQTTTGTAAGSYTVVVTDGNTCTSLPASGTLTVNARPTVTVNDATICEGDAAAIFTATSATATAWIWSDNGSGTEQTTTGTTAGSYTVVVTDGNTCTSLPVSGTLTVNILPTVTSTTGAERCGEGSVSLEALVSSGTIDWYDTSSGGTLQGTGSPWSTGSISDTTTYYAEAVSLEGCTSLVRMSALTMVHSTPEFSLGEDTLLCIGDSIHLGVGLNNVTFLWPWNGSASDSILVTTSGTYDVVVTDTNDCVGNDAVLVTFLDVPLLNLGPDSSICEGDRMLLNAGSDGVRYFWNTGDSTSTIFIDSAATYIVTVSNAANCISTDSIVVTVDTVPNVNLGLDTSICYLENIVLDASNPGASYIWSNGSDSSAIIVSNGSDFSVVVTNSFLCSDSDTIKIDINPLPNVNLGPNREVCKYLPIELIVPEENANSYLWNTGDTGRYIFTDTSGLFFVDVYSINNCFNTDTIVVLPGPDLIIQLLNDSVICDGSHTNIYANVQNQTGALIYEWNTSEIQSYIAVDSTGQYSVLIKDDNGCWGSDTTTVRVQNLPNIELSADTLSMCSMDEANELVTISSSHNGLYVEWGDGSIGEDYISSVSGWFEAVVYDQYNCSAFDSITVFEYCRPIRVTLPNIFTPNGDGHNDGFIPFEMVWEDLEYMLANLEYIYFNVYNRWGELIHSSNSVVPYWNGLNSEGLEASDGIYFWTLDYSEINGGKFYNNGYVKLKR